MDGFSDGWFSILGNLHVDFWDVFAAGETDPQPEGDGGHYS